MTKVRGSFFLGVMVLALLFAVSCTENSYETGDGGYSYLRADLADVSCGEKGRMRYALTDDNDSLVFQPVYECSWMTKADTTYRALLYYSRKEVEVDLPSVSCISAQQVLVLRPLTEVKTKATDPLSWESAWIGSNGNYLNLGLYLKTGKADEEDKRQSLGVVCDSIVERGGEHEYFLRLLHSQNGVPENYSTRIFASIPLEYFQTGDVVTLRVNTYDGEVMRSFIR